jgi:hypothetical protein
MTVGVFSLATKLVQEQFVQFRRQPSLSQHDVPFSEVLVVREVIAIEGPHGLSGSLVLGERCRAARKDERNNGKEGETR